MSIREIIAVVMVSLVGVARANVQPVVPLRAQPFPLQGVRLLDGPFRDAMSRDEKYLLSLDPDRLLHTFRLNVGLASNVKPLGGWEEPNVDLRGHSMGHYLTALSLMYASTGEGQLKQRVDYIVAELAKCQGNSPKAGFNEGYLSAFPESLIERVEKRQNVWAPYYTLHKIMAGLLDANQLSGNTQALVVLEKMAGWVQFRVDRLSPEQMQRSLDTEHGGMNEMFSNLYAVTGNTNHLRLAAAFNHERVLGPLARGEDQLNGLHANTQIPKAIGAAREYVFTGDTNYLAMANTFWESVAVRRSYVIGGHSDREHFFPVTEFTKHLSPDTAETCNTYNMLKLTRELFALDPSGPKMDFYERGLFNHILASQDPQSGMFVYLMSLKPGHFKTYSTPEDSFWCCVGTGMENHAKYGDTVYSHDVDSLYVNLFIASELSWEGKGIILRQETRFPESDTTVLKFKAAKPVTLALKIRHPAWATDGLKISVNGKKQRVSSTPGSYVTLQREWRDGDKVEVRLPLRLRIEFLPGTTNQVAVLYGPIVLAGELGAEAMPNPMATTQTALNGVPTPAAPMFTSAADPVVKRIKPVSGRPLAFQTRGIGRPKDVTLIPFYQLHRQRYSVYWQLITEADWQRFAPERAAAEAKRMAEEARVVDVVHAGEQQSDTDHAMRGEGTQTGDAYGFKWREATGWFSYQVKVSASQANQLVVSFRGGDRNPADFEVSVDATVLSPQRAPGRPNDALFELPPALIQVKQTVTVKFAARPGKSVPGVTTLRVLRSEPTR